MKQIKTLGWILAATGLMAQGALAQSASDSASALATITIKRKIKIEKQADLNFGEAYQGDDMATVAFDDAEGRNAEFIVTGREDATFSVDLPDNGTVQMVTGPGSTAQTQVNVNEFTSNVGGDGATGTISGETTLTVGATRDSILADQEEGSYEATFTVTVAYQ
jgi:hypothetical protein